MVAKPDGAPSIRIAGAGARMVQLRGLQGAGTYPLCVFYSRPHCYRWTAL